MQIRIEMDELVAEIKQYRLKKMPDSRKTLIENSSREALKQVIQLNPVETGRSRSAWVASLQELGGTPPPGWQGESYEPDAIEEGRASAELSRMENRHQSEIKAVSRVNYVAFLEYGTWKMTAFAMARKSLLYVKSLLQRR